MKFYITVVDCVAVSGQRGTELRNLRLILNATEIFAEVKWGAPLKDNKKILVNAQASVFGKIAAVFDAVFVECVSQSL